jgi:hypothetical protein
MAPPSAGRSSPSKKRSPRKKRPAGHRPSSDPAPKRVAALPSNRISSHASSPRVITPASKAAAEKATKIASAVQVNISFGSVEKYKPGLKILLQDTIYGKDEVRVDFCLFVLMF